MGHQIFCHIVCGFMERYRSGHNGAVLKTVRAQAHVGSNPTFSAILFRIIYKLTFCIYFCNVYRWDSLRRLLLSIELRKARSLEQQVALDLQANRASLTVALLG